MQRIYGIYLHMSEKNTIFASAFVKTRSSAVGSAPRSGRGGRAFESPLLDNRWYVQQRITFVFRCYDYKRK